MKTNKNKKSKKDVGKQLSENLPNPRYRGGKKRKSKTY